MADILQTTFSNEFFYEDIWILNNISLKFVPECEINNIPELVQIMAWCWLGHKPLFESMMVLKKVPLYINRLLPAIKT